MSINLKLMKKEEIFERLQNMVKTERAITAEIIEYIKEIDRRRLYLELGYASLFMYLTKGLGYATASAQRRIDAARWLKEIPEMKEDLKSGALSLLQVAMLAQNVRQKQKEDPQVKFSAEDKRELLESVKNMDLATTQKTIAQKLDLPVQLYEKLRWQQDDSVRLEITLTKEQLVKLNRAKELVSHSYAHLNFAELIELLTDEHLKRKDPLLKKPTSKMEVMENQIRKAKKNDLQEIKKSFRTRLPTSIRKAVFQRDQFCQWKDPRNGKLCRSHFQLEVDHLKPIWAGGENELSNLQILCRKHNQFKYQQQANLKTV